LAVNEASEAGRHSQPASGVPEIGHVRGLFEGHTADATSVAFSPNGKLLAAGGADKTVRVWAVDGGTPPRTLIGHAGPLAAVAFSPDGKLLASGGEDCQVRLWDTDTWQARVLGPFLAEVVTLAFDPGGTALVVGTGWEDNGIHVVDLAGGRPVRVLRGHTRNVTAVAVGPDGRTLASGGLDHTVRLWDLSSGREKLAGACPAGKRLVGPRQPGRPAPGRRGLLGPRHPPLGRDGQQAPSHAHGTREGRRGPRLQPGRRPTRLGRSGRHGPVMGRDFREGICLLSA
jgi:hypothetical protein